MYFSPPNLAAELGLFVQFGDGHDLGERIVVTFQGAAEKPVALHGAEFLERSEVRVLVGGDVALLAHPLKSLA